MSDAAPIAFTPVRTARLELRPPVADDRAMMIRFQHDSAAHFAPWSPGPPPDESPEQGFERQLSRACSGLADGTALRLIGIELASGEMVGRFNLNNITRGVAQYADAGWMVGLAHVRRGFGAKGVGALLDIAFAPPPRGLGLHRVQANVIPGNEPSLRLAARCGFRVEGLAREMLRINDRWQDHVMHAKLSHEHEFRYLRER